MKRKQKIIDISNMSEEAVIHAWETKLREDRQTMMLRFGIFLVIGMFFLYGFLNFHFVAIPRMVSTWLGVN